jgi:hypothetical protein
VLTCDCVSLPFPVQLARRNMNCTFVEKSPVTARSAVRIKEFTGIVQAARSRRISASESWDRDRTNDGKRTGVRERILAESTLTAS